MTPSPKFMTTGQLVNAFKKGSWQRAQEVALYSGYLEESGICEGDRTGLTCLASLELESHFHLLLATGKGGENYPFHSKLFWEISFFPYTFANIQPEHSVTLNAQVVS